MDRLEAKSAISNKTILVHRELLCRKFRRERMGVFLITARKDAKSPKSTSEFANVGTLEEFKGID